MANNPDDPEITGQTPMGRTSNRGTVAPTQIDIRSNPGAYENTQYDIILRTAMPNHTVIRQFSYVPDDQVGAHQNWASWYRADPKGALEWMNHLGTKGGDARVPDLNLKNLGPAQKKAMGIE